MDRNTRNAARGSNDGSPPSAAWLFAQALLGKPVPSPASAQAEARAKRQRLEWLASISTEHERQLRRLQSDEAEARRKRELLTWLASFSTEHERQLRRIQVAEAEAAEAQRNYERFAEPSDIQEANWDPSKHPRGGFAQNRGWWSPSGGAGGGDHSLRAPYEIEVAPNRDNRLAAQISKLSDEKQQQQNPSTARTASAQQTTPRSHLPADHRGALISGMKGQGVFRYNDSPENRRLGIAGKEVRFTEQNIAIGGFPPEAYYQGSANLSRVDIETVTGLEADNLAADAEMRKKLRNPNWQRPEGYVWNHAGPPGSKAMELVDANYHEAVAHRGPAAEPRAARRIARGQGTSGRALGILNVYLVARDVLQAGGILEPDYTVVERESYQFVAEDGSVFVVRPKGLFSSPRREFVAGPRKGQSEEITEAQVRDYRELAEKEWGKYVPGTLISGPRFIPGTRRKRLPRFVYEFGVPRESGWIDEDGVHHYPTPKPAQT